MLKAVPNKNAGFIILLTSILILLLFGECINGHFRILSLNCCFFLIIICFLWIGAQLPQEIFISYGRILTLFYYKIIIYLLFVYWGSDSPLMVSWFLLTFISRGQIYFQRLLHCCYKLII